MQTTMTTSRELRSALLLGPERGPAPSMRVRAQRPDRMGIVGREPNEENDG